MRQGENARGRIPMRRRPYPDCRKLAKADSFIALVFAVVVCLHAEWLAAQGQKVAWSAQEQGIVAQLRNLRSLPDEQRAHVTADLARAIGQLPASSNRLILASGLGKSFHRRRLWPRHLAGRCHDPGKCCSTRDIRPRKKTWRTRRELTWNWRN